MGLVLEGYSCLVLSFNRVVCFLVRVGLGEGHFIYEMLEEVAAWVLNAQAFDNVHTNFYGLVPGVQLARESSCLFVSFAAVKDFCIVCDLDALKHLVLGFLIRSQRTEPIELPNDAAITQSQVLRFNGVSGLVVLHLNFTYR